jgi:hypothetical protein
LAAATTMSCGTGIRDGKGEVFVVNRTIGPEGGQIVLGEATLDVGPHCLNDSTLITLRRFPTIDHAGAIGAVFEIEIPTPDTFQLEPQIGISTAGSVAANQASMIGFLHPGIADEQWVPDSPSPLLLPCSQQAVCGRVQSGEFKSPGSGLLPTTKLDFAIVTHCDLIGDCSGSQTCSSSACQQCYDVSSCNPPSP